MVCADTQCHQRKLRCSGEWPCKRCRSTGVTCEYGVGRVVPPRNASATHERVQQLEQTVSTLLSALTSTGASGPAVQPAQSVRDEQRMPWDSPPSDRSHVQHQQQQYHQQRQRQQQQQQQPSIGSGQRGEPATASPQSLINPWLQPCPHDSVSTACPMLSAEGSKRPGKDQKAEERLELATKGSFEPPFRPLTYAVSRPASTTVVPS